MTTTFFDPAGAFAGTSTVATPNLLQLMDWRGQDKPGVLRLPPIQRSLVWRNAQIVNYWDSLLRGYPAGMFLVHRAGDASEGASAALKGSDKSGVTRDTDPLDWQLFDGQQRMTALLLGRGEGQLASDLKLWIDLGRKPGKASGLLFSLRISSRGQPFGYREESPNEKFSLRERQEWWDSYGNTNDRADALFSVEGSKLLKAKCAIPLAEAVSWVVEGGDQDLLAARVGSTEVDRTIATDFALAVRTALESEAIVRNLPSTIVGNAEEYVRFFGRIGQGGTALTNDELTYSMIKQRFPHVRDRMRDIVKAKGRFAGDVDLVLAAMRIARVQLRRTGQTETEGVGRPDPRFVSGLEPDGKLETFFLRLLPEHPVVDARELGWALTRLRQAIAYDSHQNLKGLPVTLLARMPSELVDTLVSFAVLADDRAWAESRDALRAFALHSLLFVSDQGKAANLTFRHVAEPQWRLSCDSLRTLIDVFEQEGIARVLPRPSEIEAFRAGAEALDTRLRPWTERFRTPEQGDQHGEALRMLATHNESIKRSLLWLQREYLHKRFGYYDPTSGSDEDLPFDLDHIIPADVFGFDWRYRDRRLSGDQQENANFRWERGGIGNSLGNYRWLCASDNRRRGKGKIDVGPKEGKCFYLLTDLDRWEGLIPGKAEQQQWTIGSIAEFQRLIEGRAVSLYERILLEGLAPILPS